MRRLFLVDTTLRDGEQRAGLAFSPSQKLACALALDAAGIDQIEAGIPAMGEEERSYLRALLSRRHHALVSTWNRMNERDIAQSLALRPDILHVSVPSSDLQITLKLRTTRDSVIERLRRCVTLAQSGGAQVTLGLEDASRADPDFLRTLVCTALSLGVRRVRYADTVGVGHPGTVMRDIALLGRAGAEVECHAHDDLGMAVANSLCAARAGAHSVDLTFLGIGERAGNCDYRKFLTAAGGIFSFGVDPAGAAALERQVRSILDLGKRAVFA